MATLHLLLDALVALPKVGAYIEALIDAISAWRMARLNRENASAIADATAFALRAETKEDRVEAAGRWQTAFRRAAPR